MIASLGRPEAPDAEFLIVDLYTRNNDRTASTLAPLKLVDALGREYEESSKGTFMPGTFDTLKQLNPGVSSRGYVVFDVPHGKYSLQVSGGFESGEHALIDLSPRPQSENATTEPTRRESPNSMPSPESVAPTPAQPATSEMEQNAATPTTDPRRDSPQSSTPETVQAQPLPRLQFDAGNRLLIRVISINRQPDKSFTFRGTLLQPITLADGGLLDQNTKLSGWGSVGIGGHVIVSVTRLTISGTDYALHSSPGEKEGPGGASAIELVPDRTLELFLAKASVYEKTSSAPAW
jgi:hypothetical protein